MCYGGAIKALLRVLILALLLAAGIVYLLTLCDLKACLNLQEAVKMSPDGFVKSVNVAPRFPEE